jgi:hypothetical protein
MSGQRQRVGRESIEKKDDLNKILKNIKEYRERKRNREKERLKMRE